MHAPTARALVVGAITVLIFAIIQIAALAETALHKIHPKK